MSQNMLDPWSDAALIAARLAGEGVRLVVVIGAVAWCETCRILKPHFDALAMEYNDQSNVWLWLDLEDHAEFIDDFIPENLPLIISYSGQLMTHATTCQAADGSAILELIRTKGRLDHIELPDIRRRLMTVDWAA